MNIYGKFMLSTYKTIGGNGHCKYYLNFVLFLGLLSKLYNRAEGSHEGMCVLERYRQAKKERERPTC